MKEFKRKNQLLSLCGLNCGLCPMFLGKYCGGCGNGNSSCKIAKCGLEHGNIEYCFECKNYPCAHINMSMNTTPLLRINIKKKDLKKSATHWD